MWGSVCGQHLIHNFHPSELNFGEEKHFVSEPKLWYEIAYTAGCHYDGVLPIRTDIPQSPPPLTRDTALDTITVG